MRMLLHGVLAAVLSAVLSAPGFAGDLPMAKPEAVGLSQERLERITAAMQEDYENGAIRGALAMVAREGKVAYLETVGMADAEEEIPMEPDTLFRIYSMSKPITSVGVMILFEEGHFFLTDPVSKYIPELGGLGVIVQEGEFGDGPVFNIPEEDPTEQEPQDTTLVDVTTVPANRDMTIQDLLRHTSGLTYGFFGNTEVDLLYQQTGIMMTDRDIAQTVEKLGTLPLLYHPGETWHYSVSTDVLGRLIEVVSGQPFDEFLEERIFEPLDMNDTAFWVPEVELERLAQMYTPTDDGGLAPAPAFYSRNFVNDPTLHSGGGGLVSTVSDYFRFCQMMLNGGELDGTRILSRKTVELMTQDHTQGIELPMRETGYAFGLGFAVAQEPGLIGLPVSRGEYNWGGAAGTRFWIDPVEEFIGIYMVQILPHTNMRFGEKFKVLAYQSIAD